MLDELLDRDDDLTVLYLILNDLRVTTALEADGIDVHDVLDSTTTPENFNFRDYMDDEFNE